MVTASITTCASTKVTSAKYVPLSRNSTIPSGNASTAGTTKQAMTSTKALVVMFIASRARV